MKKQFKHKNKGFTVDVEARRGKPVITNLGMIKLNIPYKGCKMVSSEIFFESFEEVA